jgi:hypothetical protein
LAAAVAVADQLDVNASWAALMDGHRQRVQGQLCAHVAGELPADDAAAVGIQDEREEDHALPAAQVRDVAHLEASWRAGAEVTLHQVRAALGERIGRGGAPGPAAALGALEACARIKPLDPAAPDGLARAGERLCTRAVTRRRDGWPRAARGRAPAAAGPRSRAGCVPVLRWLYADADTSKGPAGMARRRSTRDDAR